MKIKKLIWLSEEAKEAELLIVDREFQCVVFCYPCEFKKGDLILEPLRAFMVTDLMISRKKECSVSLVEPSSLSQNCVAKIDNLENFVVSIGGIKIDLNQRMPPGAKIGDLIEFSCGRLDLW